MEPRATVFSTGARSERPSPKNSEGESGLFFGWLAISCRRYSQPPPKIRKAAAQAAARKREVLVKGHLGDVVRVNFLKEPGAFLQMEVGVLGLDANEKAVRRRVRETCNVENRMIRLRQFVQREHAENRSERGP